MTLLLVAFGALLAEVVDRIFPHRPNVSGH